MAFIPAAVGLTLLGTWLDDKYNITNDIAQIRCMRAQQAYWNTLCKEHGDCDWSYYHTIHCTYGKNDYDEAFLFEDRSWTYAQFRGEIGRLAEAFSKLGITNRTVVGMYINNSPEFMFAWWALFKLGAIPAPINTSITQEPFRHCLKVSSSQLLITTYELLSAATRSITSDHPVPLLQHVLVYDYDTYPSLPLPSSTTLISQSNLPPLTSTMASWPAHTRPSVRNTDTSQYLFTSGTTGLPKALIWPTGHSLMGAGPVRWPRMFDKRRRSYICTPMFHGGAAFAVLPATFGTGGTIVLARKFSVKRFWPDVRRSRANMIFYIGEMVRYLVQAPPDPMFAGMDGGERYPKAHGLEVIYGLGITPPVWRAFRDRFGVPWIAEYYGASEGTTAICNSNFSNLKGVSKVAHWGPLMRSKWFGQRTFYILRVDMETGEVVRDIETGLCLQAGFGEVGEAVNRVVPPLQRRHDYVGEKGVKATEEKTVRDVFEKRDVFWRLGDALSMDEEGFVTFHDRLGDTFRTKGHNISTAEVEMAFINHPHIASANVFAINLAKHGYEGQVGCAALNFRDGSDQDVSPLEQYLLDAGLAPYAVPRFLRVLVEDSTDLGNLDSGDVGSERVSLLMKKLKTGLRRDGIELPSQSRDRMFWLENQGSGYVELTADMKRRVLSGKAML